MFEDAEGGDPDPLTREPFRYSWEEVKAFFVDHARKFEAFFAG
jgi:hypothetical protein